MPELTAVERVEQQGGSPALVKWTGRIESWLPLVAPVFGFLASVYARFSRHRGSVLAGGLAFFATLSLVPAVLSLGSLAALMVEPEDFIEDLTTLVGGDSELLAFVTPIITGVLDADATTLASLGTTGLISLVVSLYAASRFVYVARQVLDLAFELDPEPPSVLWRTMAIVLTLGTQIAIVVAVAVLAVIPRILQRLGLDFLYADLLQVVEVPVIAGVVYLLLTVAMRFGTRARRAVGWWNLGALMGTVIVALGSVGLGWYLSFSFTFSQVVGTLGSVIALELWLFVVCVAIVISAEVEGIQLGFTRRDDTFASWTAPTGSPRPASRRNGATGSGHVGGADPRRAAGPDADRATQ